MTKQKKELQEQVMKGPDVSQQDAMRQQIERNAQQVAANASNASLVYPLSAQDVCFCASFNGCGGGMIMAPWTHIKRAGAVTGGLYKNSGPYTGMCADFSRRHMT